MDVLTQLLKLGAYESPVFVPGLDESLIKQGYVVKKENGYMLTDKALKELAVRVGRSVRSVLSTGPAILVTAFILTRRREVSLFNPKEIAEALGISQPAVIMSMKYLIKDGKVKKLVRGGYVLTPAGVSAAKKLLQEVVE